MLTDAAIRFVISILILLLTLSLDAQSQWIKGSLELNDGTQLQGKIYYTDYKALNSSVLVSIGKNKKVVNPKDINQLIIGKDEFYQSKKIRGKRQLIQQYESGKISMYVGLDQEIYLEKDGVMRLLYATRFLKGDETESFIDTITSVRLKRNDIYEYKKHYLNTIAEFCGYDASYYNNETQLRVNTIKRIVRSYNRKNGGRISHFNKNTTITLSGAYGITPIFREFEYPGFDYFIEIQNRKASRYLSFFATYRPYIKDDKNNTYNLLQAGFRIYPLTYEPVKPYLMVGAQAYEFEPPSLFFGLGTKVFFSKQFGIFGDGIYNNKFGYRGGVFLNFSI